jgi:hypothetical protein
MKNTATTSASGRAFGIVLLLLIFLFGGFLLVANNSGQGNSLFNESLYKQLASPKTAAELRAELLEKEQSSPSEYLDASGKYWRNWIDQLVVEGTITNNASIAAFKDPVISVEWYSKTGTLIGEESYRLYEYVKPGREVHYKFKMKAPAAVKSVSIGVTDATPMQ